MIALSEPLVDVRGLSIAFPAQRDEPVVEGIDLAIHPGECVALVGESGSGKSVTARSLLNLAGDGARVEAAQFRIHGRDARIFREADWRHLRGTFTGLVMQDALVSLDPLRTIGQEVGEVLTEHRLVSSRVALAERVHATLAKVGMPRPAERARQFAHQLSGGLRQRALIAAAIAAEPDLIVADEPTTALDPGIQEQVLAVLAARVQEGAGLLLISHDLALVARIAHRVIVMRAGRIVDAGATQDVLTQPRHPYTRQLLAATPSFASRGGRLASARIACGHDTSAITRDPLPSRVAVEPRPVLEVRSIAKHYAQQRATPGKIGAFTALEEVSFTVRAGEVLGIIGASGSGKSTCAKIVLGLLEPDAGEVRLLGESWSGIPESRRRPLRRRLQYIPQDPLSSFDPRYRVEDIVAENLPNPGAKDRRARLLALLDQVGLNGCVLDRHPRALSGGQRQRVAIARALAAEPALIVCDEPVSALDIGIQAQILDLLADLQSQLGTALLFISHDWGVVQHLADRVLVFQDGKIVDQGSIVDVFGSRGLRSSLPNRNAA
ncbi:nickel ABC transporter ATP-binding protein NikE [Methylobacterium sp. NPDC080182]|uniref:nickel ABC transporter ATP-binding protein NikE n=1 Tax=unclassified Methylobacterium TaxID=2615210 RepID=UPI0008A778EC|nr:ABC transporter ATP-binding protein [Methylobacterium sp. 275MFSha3.1]SEI15631.1 peptide/nickel transport system ATP-binding protein [Methylobacterium sp. 275MFSha3.1]